MKYINLCIDTEGLRKNGLHVYQRDGDGIKKVDAPQFIITNGRADLASDFVNPFSAFLTKDITPKQYNNIVFFETLKAFRR